MRDSAEISQKSAASISKWRIQELLDTDEIIGLEAFAMKQALLPGGGVDRIADILYGMGLKLSVDRNNSEHQDWIAAGAVEIEKE